MNENLVATPVDTSDREMVITRLLNAPRELVFKVWTDPKHVVQWWGPKGFTNTIYEMDVRPGGVWRYMMHGPDGVDYPNKIVFIEVVPPQRLVYLHGKDDSEDGQFRGIITFDDVDGKTNVTLRVIFKTVAQFEENKKFGAIEGGNSTLDCLEEYLSAL
jgi:uncharacterized protein YndB with AHSA1/START domain